MSAGKYQIAIANQQKKHAIEVRKLRSAVKEVLAGEQILRATISIAVVDDPTIHRLNRQYLQHDYPTDVLSFVLEQDDKTLDGEIILSADTASSASAEYGWSAHEELILYAIHGTLHLIGYDDHSAADRRRMRAKENEYLARAGIARK
jgi:probable rRNA maturation factor